MKKFIFFILLIGLAAGGYIYWKYYRTPVESEMPKVKTTQVERGTIFLIVDTAGKVESNRDVEIKCKSSGQVIKLPFEVSDFVRTGQLLVELDPVDEQRAVQQAKVGLSASQARLAQAKQNLLIAETRLDTDKKKTEANWKAAQARATELQAKLQRLKGLLQSKLTSQQDYEAAETAYVDATTTLDRSKISMDELKLDEMALEVKRQDVHLAQAEVELDEIALSTAEQRLRDTKVFAPCDGFISERKIQIGQIISSGISNVGGGTSIMTVSDLSQMFVAASVDESDIGRVSLGMPVIVTTDAFPNNQFPGKVVLISTKGVSTSNVVTFEVRIEVLGESKKLLKPEMTAAIKIIASEKNNALLIPSESVFQKTTEELEAAKNQPLASANTPNADNPNNKPVEGLTPSEPGIKPEHTGKPGRVPDGENHPRRGPRNRNPNGQSNPVENATTTSNPPATSPTTNPPTINASVPISSEEAALGLTKEKIEQIYSTRMRRYFVQISKTDGQTEEREIKIGIDDGTKTEVLEGLKEGDVIVVEKGYLQSKWQNPNNMPGRRMGGPRGGPH